MRYICRVLLLALLTNAAASAEARVEKNVIYGMYSGLALLTDIHRPAQPNGYGLIFIPGSGWYSNQSYDATPLTGYSLTGYSPGNFMLFVPKLLDAGYTVFVINHRNGPHFRYPAPVEDAQRAVRFVRYNAKMYGIDPDTIGAVGHSSGAHLSALLGVLDGKGDADDPDPINRVSARVQCVVAGAPAIDLEHYEGRGTGAMTSFMGQPLPARPPDPVAIKAYRAASPITHVAASSAPMLLLHGDADRVVSFHQSEFMEAAMKKAGAEVKFVRLTGGGHGFPGETAKHADWPDIFAEAVRWLDQHLK